MATTNSLPISQLKPLSAETDRQLDASDLFVISDGKTNDYTSYKLSFEELYETINDLMMEEIAENYTSLSGIVDNIDDMLEKAKESTGDYVLGVKCGRELL